jgi:Fe-S-cluster containining protein
LVCKYLDLDLPDEVSNNKEQIFEILEDAFNKTKDYIKQLDLEYGLNGMTCIETGCQDCCTKTFPDVSYTEYLYIYEWLNKQPEDFKNRIYKSSKEVVTLYKKKYGKEPPFLKGETDIHCEYPMDFTFDCPFLGDNKCNVYEARPFACRAYGYGSRDGIRYKGCNYFYEQFKGATKLTDIRKVISIPSFYKFSRIADEKLIGKRIRAPIPVWFSQSHEEVLEKIKKL